MMNRNMRNLLVTMLFVLAAAPVARATTVDPLTLRLLQGNDLQYPIADQQTPTRDIRVDIWSDVAEDEVIRRGEAYTLNFQTNTDLYVVIYRIDVEGRVEVLWPESRYNDGFVYGNHTYAIPSPADGGRLRVGNRKGVEYVEAIASAYPFDLRALGIDFRFDRNDYSRHDYYIDGDPFLAVNDINYAITGLEEDVDYVVTDWLHLYVEERVEYARYSCNQCHLDDTGHPTVTAYVDTCTQVEVRVDWGWYNSWWVSFGWYPLYYEPAFYYWDWRWSRPYWYAWYPVPYRWPAYSCYTRPYPVYWWKGSGYWAGDYASHWSKRRTRSVPLYDVERTRSRTTTVSARDGTKRTVVDRPVSARGKGYDNGRRVDRDSLVRNSRPPRQVDRPDAGSSRKRGDGAGQIVDPGRGSQGRGAIRTDRNDRERIVSQRPADDGRGRSQVGADRGSANRENGRRWTRPQVQNDRQPSQRPSGRGGEVLRSPDRDSRRTPAVDRSRSGGSSNRSGNVDRPRSGGSSNRSGNVDRPRSGGSSNRSGDVDRSRSGRSGSVERPKTNRSSGRSSPPRQKIDRSGSRSSGKGSQVQPRQSTPRPQPKSKPAPRSRGGSGNSRKGGGGRKG